MLIFGVRGKSVQHQLDAQHAVLLMCRYFHLFWLLRVAFGKRYVLATQTPQGWAQSPLTEQEARDAAGGTLPKPSFWDQWSLPLGLVVITVCAILPALLKH